MASGGAPQLDLGSPGVELLSEVADPAAPTASRARAPERLVVVVAGMVAVGLGLVLLVVGPPAPEPEPGRSADLEFRFGDPFAVEWVELQQVAGPTASGQPPLPMVGSDGRCLGFARTDWPAGERHPSVAHCLDGAGLERFAGADTVGVHRIIAGADTWIFLFFGGPVTELDLAVDAGPGAPSIDGPLPVHQSDAIAAVLVPTSAVEVTIGWRRVDGGRYRTSIS